MPVFSLITTARWGAALAAIAALGGCVVAPVESAGSYHHDHMVVTRYGYPPPPRVERRPHAPGPHHTWEQGRWEWSGQRYHWHTGRWVMPHTAPRPPMVRPPVHSAPPPPMHRPPVVRPRPSHPSSVRPHPQPRPPAVRPRPPHERPGHAGPRPSLRPQPGTPSTPSQVRPPRPPKADGQWSHNRSEPAQRPQRSDRPQRPEGEQRRH